MAYPPHFMDELKSRTSLMRLVGRRVKLTRRGNEYVGCCPFHSEKTPSFHVVEDKDFYHCFGCGANGSAISFCMEAEGMSFPEAVEYLAKAANMQVPKQTIAQQQEQQKRLGLYDVTELACQFFQRALYSPHGKQALEYLYGRGLTDSTIKHFRLGYAPNGNALQTHLSNHKVSKEDMNALGLVRFNDRGEYSFFRDRIMFTICDEKGRPIAFGGRFMGDEKAANTGKYVNSPDTPLFDKGQTLYNLHHAKTIARKTQTIIVAEGYMDVIAMTQVGISSVVAPLGTATTESQLQKLWRLVDAPVLCFDGDAAGKRAGLRASERALPLLTAGKTLQLCFMPQGLDPDDFIKQRGVNALREHLQETTSLVETIWHMEFNRKPLTTPENKADFEKRLLQRAGEINDRTVSNYYKGTFKDWLWSQVKRSNQNKNAGQGGKKSSGNRGYNIPINPMGRTLRTLPQTAYRRRQQTVLAIGINHPSITHLYWDSYENLNLDNDISQIRNGLLSALVDNSDATATELQQILSDYYPAPMADILSPNLYTLFPQAKPTADPEKALELLENILDIAEQESLKTRLNQICQDPTQTETEKWQNLKSIQDYMNGDKGE